jgi:hypothetical protein
MVFPSMGMGVGQVEGGVEEVEEAMEMEEDVPSFTIDDAASAINMTLPIVTILPKLPTVELSKDFAIIELMLPDAIKDVKVVASADHFSVIISGQVHVHPLETMPEKDGLGQFLKHGGHTFERLQGTVQREMLNISNDWQQKVTFSKKLEPTGKWGCFASKNGTVYAIPFEGEISKEVQLSFKRPKVEASAQD